MGVSMRFLVLALACAALLPVTAGGAPAHVPIGYVQVIRINQTAYQPVAFRIAVKAPVGLRINVGYKVFDTRGRGVHSKLEDFVQPFAETTLTVRWNKRGYDGLPAPKRRRYYVVPFASDLEDRDGDDRRGQLVRGRRLSFVLR